MGIVQGSIDFVYVPRQTKIVDIPGKAAHHIIPGEGPDLTTWRVTGKEPGLACMQSFLPQRCFLCNTVLFFEVLWNIMPFLPFFVKPFKNVLNNSRSLLCCWSLYLGIDRLGQSGGSRKQHRLFRGRWARSWRWGTAGPWGSGGAYARRNCNTTTTTTIK